MSLSPLTMRVVDTENIHRVPAALHATPSDD